jgi:hypothetical protein
MQELGRLGSRIIVATGIYVVIIVLATPLPSAAGLMLTFPALNGLAFFFSEDARAASIARSMFWMPVVNGGLCAGYMLGFVVFAKTISPAVAGWGLLIATVGLWFAWVTRKTVRAGIDHSDQLKFAVAATLGGAACTIVAVLLMNRLGLAPRTPAWPSDLGNFGWIVDAIVNGRLKIALFAATLAVLLTAIAYFPITDSTRGILAGLPLVPFGGLVSVGGDAASSAQSRVEIFLGMIGGVWLGAAVAIWFIFCFSRYLGARTRLAGQPADIIGRFSALVAGWLLTFAIIVAMALAIDALSLHQRPALVQSMVEGMIR